MNYMEAIYEDADILLSYNDECVDFPAFEGYGPIEDAEYIQMLMESDNELIDAGGRFLISNDDARRQAAVDRINELCREKVDSAKKQKNINKALGTIGIVLTGLTGASAAANGITNPATIVAGAVTAAIGIAKSAHDNAVVSKRAQEIDDYIDDAIVKTEEVIARGKKDGTRDDARALISLRDSLKKEKKRLHSVLPF